MSEEESNQSLDRSGWSGVFQVECFIRGSVLPSVG
jgi:hypothetical protein